MTTITRVPRSRLAPSAGSTKAPGKVTRSIHSFSNEPGAPASMLVLFTPGAPRGAYFEELAAIVASGRTLAEEEWTEPYARHDQYAAD